MSEMKNSWEKRLKEKLNETETPVPDFLWESIERDLPKPNPFKRRFYAFQKIAAAIAVIAAIGGTFFLLDNSDDKIENVIDINKEIGKEKQTLLSDNNPTAMPEQTTEGTGLKEALPVIAKTTNNGSHKLTAVYKEKEKELLSENVIMLAETIENETEAEETEVQASEEIDKEEQSESSQRSFAQHNALGYAYDNDSKHVVQPRPEKKNRNKKWSVSFETGNAYSSNGTINMGVPMRETLSLLQANQISTYESMFMKGAIDDPQTYVKHYFPVTGAITVRKYLTKRISVETGLQYTMLRSDIKSKSGMDISIKQKLQYLGVPVKFNYDIFTAKGFTIYGGIGGALEGCISAKRSKEIVRKQEIIQKSGEDMEMNHKVQWSANAAVGVQFNPIKMMGIYAEPGLTYFFDDKNNIETIRKEHPLNFQLKVGIRIGF